jgi:hypothetical protein
VGWVQSDDLVSTNIDADLSIEFFHDRIAAGLVLEYNIFNPCILIFLLFCLQFVVSTQFTESVIEKVFRIESSLILVWWDIK